jgi:type I restriction enzyme S subunit
MIADLQPYPEYRTAEGDWLGSVPAHWRVRRMKYILREQDSRSLDGKEQLLRVSQYTGVTKRLREDGLNEPDTRAESLVGYKRVEPNNLVINIMLAWNGSMGVSRFAGIASPAYCVYRFGSGALPWYFHYLLRSPTYRSRIKAVSTGVVESRLRLYTDDLYRIEALQPPLDEQAAIVRFLDWANGRLERAIRAKKKLIALLNEQKQVIIHRAVTRGLDPDVPLTPAGILWLGDIPEHWKVTKLKYLSPQITVGIVIQPARLYIPKGVPCLRSLNISSGRISTDELVFIGEGSHRANRKSRLNKGDVVVVRTGRTGIAAIVDEAFDGANCIDLLIVRKSLRLISEYLLMYLRSHGAQSDIAFNSVGAIQAHYNTATIANLRIPLPTVPEQEAILRDLETALAGPTAASHRTEREIGLLREYWTRLVADVVTGKLDVRAAAGRLPAEEEELPAPIAAEDLTEDAELELVASAD